MKKIIITIDGFSSCGKSTLAKQLAKALNYVFVDSGAMYRAITLYFLRNQINWDDSNEVLKALDNIHLSFSYNAEKGTSDMLLNGENVEILIREMQISDNVSAVSAIKEVRTFTVAQQQLNTESKGIVMDGRDIGTVVFPNAELKIFLTASIDVRVQRRYKELLAKDASLTFERVKQNLVMRDEIDSTREVSPLKKADDAIVLDNTDITMEEQFEIALNWAKEKIGMN